MNENLSSTNSDADLKSFVSIVPSKYWEYFSKNNSANELSAFLREWVELVETSTQATGYISLLFIRRIAYHLKYKI